MRGWLAILGVSLVVGVGNLIVVRAETTPIGSRSEPSVLTQQIPIPAANEPIVSNVRDYYATISWVTTEKTAGQVQFGRSPGVYSSTAVDKRGPSYVGWTHYVDLAGLEANATYYYKLLPGDGIERTFTTAPPANFPPSPEPSMAGRVMKTNGDAAAEGNVYLRVIKPDGTASALLSYMIQASSPGIWSVVLSHARTQDLSSFIAVPSSPAQQDGWQVAILARYTGDPTHFVERTVVLKDTPPTSLVEMTVPNTGPTPTPTITATPTSVLDAIRATATAWAAAATPTPLPVSVAAGWTLVALPGRDGGPYSASSVLLEMTEQGLDGQHIAR